MLDFDSVNRVYKVKNNKIIALQFFLFLDNNEKNVVKKCQFHQTTIDRAYSF